MQNKFKDLNKYLNNISKQGICLAFSGGVDSLLLLYLCKDLNIIALTFKSCFQTKDEIRFAKEFCKQNNIKHKIIEYNPLEDLKLSTNPKDRCYLCKKIMFSKIKEFADTNKYEYIIDGTNFDDINTFRPGLRANEELKIISPFKEFKITKNEIRKYLENIDLILSKKPSSPCLATRFPYNTKLEEKSLKTIEKLEKYLYLKGFKNNRIRLHNDIARIEIPKKDFNKFIKLNSIITKRFKQKNIKYITLDIEGLRTGSMD